MKGASRWGISRATFQQQQQKRKRNKNACKNKRITLFSTKRVLESIGRLVLNIFPPLLLTRRQFFPPVHIYMYIYVYIHPKSPVHYPDKLNLSIGGNHPRFVVSSSKSTHHSCSDHQLCNSPSCKISDLRVNSRWSHHNK